jgi:hypothetical protein
LFTDQSTEIGEAENTAAPMMVNPIRAILRIVILPAKRAKNHLGILHG